MLRYRHLAFVGLGVTDLARSAAMFARLPGLTAASPAMAGEALFDVGHEGATLALSQATHAGLRRIGFEMEGTAAFDELLRVLARERVRTTAIANGIGIVEEHTGAAIEFRAPREVRATRSADGRDAIESFGHVVLRTPDYRAAVAFWRDVLGFRLSDEIDGRISLLRCFPNPLHHSLGIANGVRRMLHHVNFRVPDGFDLATARDRLAAAGFRIASGPGTHAPSRNRFLYFYDADGLTLELATSEERFPEGRERAPRILPDRPESFALDGVTRDPGMYSVGEIDATFVES